MGRAMRAVLDTEPDEEGIGQHDEGDMAIPADIAADFIVIQSKIFGGFQVLFDAPTRSNSLHDGRQGRGQWGKDQVRGHFKRRVEAATKHQEVAFVHGAMLEQGQDGPIKEPLPLVPWL